MTISNKVTKQIGTLIAGDALNTPYMSGPKLVDFYNECGFEDIYGEGFPSRWKYSMDKIVQSNGSSRLKKVLEEFVDPRRYGGDAIISKKIVSFINQLIRFDGYALVLKGNFYKVTYTQENFIQAETLQAVDHDFVVEQIEKCQMKIAANDFNGAITNSRTLAEAILIYVIEVTENVDMKNDGNIINLWSKAKKTLKIDIKKDDVPDFIFQIISGLDTSLNGLAALSNNAGDRHANKFNTKRHHAKLAVNISMTMCDFLIDVLNERRKNEL